MTFLELTKNIHHKERLLCDVGDILSIDFVYEGKQTTVFSDVPIGRLYTHRTEIYKIGIEEVFINYK